MNVPRALRIAPRPNGHTPPERNPGPLDLMRRVPVRLSPIPWGKPDWRLAKAICRHTLDATPPTVIPFDPRTDARMRRDLRTHGIHY